MNIDLLYFILSDFDFGFMPCNFKDFIHFLNTYHPRKGYCVKNRDGICIYQAWYFDDLLVAFCVFPH